MLVSVLIWVWVKLNHQGTAGFSPCFHMPGFQLGHPIFDPQPRDAVRFVWWVPPKWSTREGFQVFLHPLGSRLKLGVAGMICFHSYQGVTENEEILMLE